MHRKLTVFTGTVLTIALFLFFHAVLALGTICWMIALVPAMLFKWSIDDRKEVPVRSIANRRRL